MKFSVIVPVYNVETFLRECLDSLSAAEAMLHGSASVEIVCVDDGSTDGSGRILDECAAVNPSLRVLHKGNGGVSSARNAGLEIASGDWMFFVDADDLVRETCFADVLELITSDKELDLVGFGMLPYYGGDIDWSDSGAPSETLHLDLEVADSLAGMSVYRFAYKAELLRDLKFRPYNYGEDLVFVAEVLAQAKHGLVVQRKEYLYRFRLDSVTHVEIAPAKLKMVVAATRDVFMALAASGKTVGPVFLARRGIVWLRDQPKLILSHIGKPGWREVWNFWLDTMESAAEMRFFPRWQRIAACISARTRSRVIVYCLCRLPTWLWMHSKREGK